MQIERKVCWISHKLKQLQRQPTRADKSEEPRGVNLRQTSPLDSNPCNFTTIHTMFHVPQNHNNEAKVLRKDRVRVRKKIANREH
jgi:hypothetical protein